MLGELYFYIMRFIVYLHISLLIRHWVLDGRRLFLSWKSQSLQSNYFWSPILCHIPLIVLFHKLSLVVSEYVA